LWGSALGAGGSAGAASSGPDQRRNPVAATIKATPQRETITPPANELQAGREKGRMTPPGLGRCGKLILHTSHGGRINPSFPRKAPALYHLALAAVPALVGAAPRPL
jgi:hypothetical protein